MDDVKQPFDRQKRIKPGWKADGSESLVVVLKNGLLKTMEIEKGKPWIVVGPVGRLEPVLAKLIAATKADELEAASAAGSRRRK